MEHGKNARNAADQSGKYRCENCGHSTSHPLKVAHVFCCAQCLVHYYTRSGRIADNLNSLVELRSELIRQIEEKRGSKIITMVHREEHGTKPRHRPYITIEDSEEILYSIRSTKDDTPIDFILHCPGGVIMPAEQIALAVHRHPAGVSVIVPHYAMSGATLIALAAKEIVMDPYSVLGPLDPQINGYPSPSLIKLTEIKKTDFVSDEMLLLADIAAKSLRQMNAFIVSLINDRLGAEKAAAIAQFLTGGYLTHDRPITAEDAQSLGLPVKMGVPDEIRQLMRLYKYTSQRHGSWYSVPCGSEHPSLRQ